MQDPANSFIEKLTSYKEAVSCYLASFTQSEKPHSLYEPIRYTLNGNGKKLRPSLLLLTTEALGGDVEGAIPAAGAIEILHNFTLVHDDIMDNDETRRGRPTVHHKWDANVALLAGDGLVALAYQSLARTPTPHIIEIHKLFTDSILMLCEGQALDKEFETRTAVSMDEYMEMIGKKTGRLIGLCTQMGGVLAGARRHEIEALKVYGESLGIAFQIQDDLFDITSSEKILGKDFGSDIKSRKKTFLLIHALECATDSQRNAIEQDLMKPQIGRDEIYRIRRKFEETGTIDSALKTTQNFLAKAEESLALLAPQHGTKMLEQFLKFILKRKF
jgi:geranylgeranyl diphosphate synthase type II